MNTYTYNPYFILSRRLLVVALAYFLTARLGLSIQAMQGIATYMWVPGGIALAALYLWGYRMWPAVALAAFFAAFLQEASLILSLLISLGNTIGSVLTVYALRRFPSFDISFRSFKSNGYFILFAAVIFSLVSPLLGIGVLTYFGIVPFLEVENVLLAWWIGDGLGVLLVAPFILTWSLFSWPRTRNIRYIAELSWYLALLFLTNAAIFWTSDDLLESAPLLYLLLLPLFWSILRMGPRITTFSLLFTAVVATAATMIGRGPFGDGVRSEELLFLELFIGVVAIVFLLFLGLVEELKDASRRLAEQVTIAETAAASARRADKAKNDFIAILSHELRNPLAPLLSALELMQLQGMRSVNTPQIVESMLQNVRRMSRLLDDLLDITRISEQRFTLNKEIVPLCTIIERAIAMTGQRARERNHTLTFTPPATPFMVDADPLRLEQVFANLLNNAIKYTNPGGAISITCSHTTSHVTVTVTDSGIGIAQDMLETIFEPFMQIKRDTHTQAGLGIGLSLCRRLIELHQGTIIAKSDGLGHGTRFDVCLPLLSDQTPPPVPPQSNTSVKTQESKA